MVKNNGSKRPLMRDVANLAGVSTQTVSRVLAGSESVRKSTRERVENAITELGYKPNYAAQLLASGTSRSVGVLTVGRMFLGLAATFTSFEKTQRQRGRYVLSASAPNVDGASITQALDYLHSQSVRAVVVICQQVEVLPYLQSPSKVPTVLVMAGHHRIPGASTVSLAQSAPAREVTEHFLDQGMSDIVHVAGDLRHQDARCRRDAHILACQEAGVAPKVWEAKGWGPRHAFNTVTRQLDTVGLPQAFFAANDGLAMGVMRACSEAGFQAGRDYALAGFDNANFSGYTTPALTSVTQDYDALAEQISLQIDRLVEGGETTNVQVPAHLVIRESSILGEAMIRNRSKYPVQGSSVDSQYPGGGGL